MDEVQTVSSARVIDYAPAYPATVEVAKGLIPYIEKMPKDFAYGDDDSPEHLKWMVAEIVSNAGSTEFPIDKLSRWLGYIQGILRAHRVLDTTAERDRTRPIFHSAYRIMGIQPPKKRDRAVQEVIHTPDLATLVREWSFPFRHRVASSFVRGLTGLNDTTEQEFTSVASLYHVAIFGAQHGLLRRMVNVSKEEAARRFEFFEEFMERIRANERLALSRGNLAHLAGSLLLFSAFTAMVASASISAWAGEYLVTCAVAAVSALSYCCALALRRAVRSARDKGAIKLAKFRQSLPWKEESLDGIQLLDDIQQANRS